MIYQKRLQIDCIQSKLLIELLNRSQLSIFINTFLGTNCIKYISLLQDKQRKLNFSACHWCYVALKLTQHVQPDNVTRM